MDRARLPVAIVAAGAHLSPTRRNRLRARCAPSKPPLDASNVRVLPLRPVSRTEVVWRVRARGARHPMVLELMIGGVPVLIIQRELGHANLATRSGALDHIALADVIGAM